VGEYKLTSFPDLAVLVTKGNRRKLPVRWAKEKSCKKKLSRKGWEGSHGNPINRPRRRTDRERKIDESETHLKKKESLLESRGDLGAVKARLGRFEKHVRE